MMTLQDALVASKYEMAIRYLPTGETLIGYANGIGIVVGERVGCFRTESREATSEELDAPAEWAPV